MSENPLRPRQREAELCALVRDQFDFIWRLLRRMGLSADDADADESDHEVDRLQDEGRLGLHGCDPGRVRAEGDVQSAAAVQVRVPG